MPDDPAVAEPEQREGGRVAERAAVQVEEADRQLVVEQQRDSPGDREHRQRRDERDHPAVGDRGRVHRAKGGGEGDRPDDEQESARAVVADQDSPEHAGGGHHRAHRQVDSRRGDHEGHPDREHADHARLGEHVADVVPGRERVRLQDGADDEQEDHDPRERVLLGLQRLDAPEPRPPVGPPAAWASDVVTRPPRRAPGHRWVRRRGGAARVSVASLPVDLGHDLALAHDQDAGADANQLLELGGDHEHAQAGPGEVADDPVDLGLGGHVHAAGGLVEQQDPALVQEPAREHDLLLVAAREQADDAVGVVGHRAQRPELLARPRRARP